MKPAPFVYHRVETMTDVVGLLAQYGDDIKLLAGGQSLVPLMNMRLARFGHVVDLNDVRELETTRTEASYVELGALVRHVELERADHTAAVPLLSTAAKLIGHPAIRHRGTLGGSIAHADPAAELPTAALVLDATIIVRGPEGQREIEAANFFTDFWETTLDASEVVTAVRIPLAKGRTASAVREFTLRHGDFALAGAMCQLEEEEGVITKAAVGLMAMGPTPIRSRAVERALLGQRLESLDLSGVQMDANEVSPVTDLHASGDYRRKVCDQLVTQAVSAAVEELAA